MFKVRVWMNIFGNLNVLGFKLLGLGFEPMVLKNKKFSS
jgi:hypothetical protein